MNYGTADNTIPGHIFLSNSVSYYANSPTELCQLSRPNSFNTSNDGSNFSWTAEIVQDSDLSSVHSDKVSDDSELRLLKEGEHDAFENYSRWMEAGSNVKAPEDKRLRRQLPKTPDEISQEYSYAEIGEMPQSIPNYSPHQNDTFDQLHIQSIKGSEVMTYPEEQRQVRNYFFTKPMYFESDDNRKAENRRVENKMLQKLRQKTLTRGMAVEVVRIKLFICNLFSEFSSMKRTTLNVPQIKTRSLCKQK
ncbi:hypothetical protein B9Z55_022253 [Caenorhabditis nigoni]|nr:hypothetical protein B9Z55_022253 [Caenorhabditis nigoni]